MRESIVRTVNCLLFICATCWGLRRRSDVLCGIVRSGKVSVSQVQVQHGCRSAVAAFLSKDATSHGKQCATTQCGCAPAVFVLEQRSLALFLNPQRLLCCAHVTRNCTCSVKVREQPIAAVMNDVLPRKLVDGPPAGSRQLQALCCAAQVKCVVCCGGIVVVL